MSTVYRMVVHCDENKTDKCLGLVEYTSPDRIGLARKADHHKAQSGWLWGFRDRASVDICPECRKVIEKEIESA